MISRLFATSDHTTLCPLAVVLGTNEIASAIAVHLRRAGWGVLLSHDPYPPVIRRAMAFHDVLFGDRVVVEGIEGERAETARAIADVLVQPDRVAVSALQLADLPAFHAPELLVDARMRKYRVAPDLRSVARMTVGIGPNFRVGMNCDVAIETRPGRSGDIVRAGSTDAADGIASRLGGVGAERFVYSDRPGRWHASVGIGARVLARSAVGHLDGMLVRAPIDGIVRGLPRDGLEVPAGVKLIEIDPRGHEARWTGIDERGRSIAAATVEAVRFKMERYEMFEALAAMFYM